MNFEGPFNSDVVPDLSELEYIENTFHPVITEPDGSWHFNQETEEKMLEYLRGLKTKYGGRKVVGWVCPRILEYLKRNYSDIPLTIGLLNEVEGLSTHIASIERNIQQSHIG